MISRQLGTFYLLLLISGTLWSVGETCTPGTFTANPDVCSQYFLCVTSGGITMNIALKCREGFNFDPARRICTASYNCSICD